MLKLDPENEHLRSSVSINSEGYCFVYCKESKRTKSLSRMVLRYDGPLEVDHINRDKSDNRACNLRLSSRSENAANKNKIKNTSSRYIGVSWNRKSSVWQSKIGFKRKKIWIGSFDSEHEAARMYNLKAIELFGDFASINEVIE